MMGLLSLAEKADRLTELLLEVEDELFSKGLLVQAEVPVNRGKLRWGKRASDWMIFWVDDSDAAHALRQTSLGRRAAAVEHLPALEQAIWNAMVDRDSVIDAAITKAEEYVTKLRGVLPIGTDSK